MSEESDQAAEVEHGRGVPAHPEQVARVEGVDPADAAEAASRAARRGFEVDACEAASRMSARGRGSDAGALPVHDVAGKPDDEAAEEALESLSDLSGVEAMSAQLASDLAREDAAFAAEAARAERIADAAADEKTTLISDRPIQPSLTRQLPGHASIPHMDETVVMQRAGKMPQRLSQLPKDKRPGHRPMPIWKKLLIGIVVVAVLGGAGYGGYRLYQARTATQAKPAAGTAQSVSISVKISGLSTAEGSHYDAVGSKIPIQVSGQDASGAIVDQVGYADEKGQGLSLLPGEYELSAVASPIAADGTIYSVPSTRLSVKVQEGTSDYTGAGSLVFTVPSAGEVSDSAIADAYKYASEGGAPSDAIAKILRDAATARRDAATDAAGKQTSELRAEADDRHKATDSYSLDLPAAWYGRVDTAQNGDVLYVYLADSDTLICQLDVEKDGAGASDNSLAELGSKSLGDGTSVVARGPVYPQLIPQVTAGKVAGTPVDAYPEKTAVELVRLQTGTTYTFEQIKRGIAGEGAGDQAVAKIVQDYIAKNLMASVQAS